MSGRGVSGSICLEERLSQPDAARSGVGYFKRYVSFHAIAYMPDAIKAFAQSNTMIYKVPSHSQETRNRMKLAQYILSLLRERKLFFLAALAISLPQFIACVVAAFAVHTLLSSNNIWSFIGALKITLFLALIVYYIISLYEAWQTARET